jgi:hypothetical protein
MGSPVITARMLIPAAPRTSEPGEPDLAALSRRRERLLRELDDVEDQLRRCWQAPQSTRR